MGGSVAGGLKARNKNLSKNPNFYKEIGAMGGKAKYHGRKGFAANRELAKIAGKKGGQRSSRAGVPNRTQPVTEQQKPSLWQTITRRFNNG